MCWAYYRTWKGINLKNLSVVSKKITRDFTVELLCSRQQAVFQVADACLTSDVISDARYILLKTPWNFHSDVLANSESPTVPSLLTNKKPHTELRPAAATYYIILREKLWHFIVSLTTSLVLCLTLCVIQSLLIVCLFHRCKKIQQIKTKLSVNNYLIFCLFGLLW